MKNSIFILRQTLGKAWPALWQAAQRWLVNTPERALDRAYGAALLLNSLDCQRVADDNSFNYSGDHQDFAQSPACSQFGTFLSIIHLRLAEFKISHAVLGLPNCTAAETLRRINGNVQKLQIIDEVLAQNFIPQSLTANRSSCFQKSAMMYRSDDDQLYPVTIAVKATKILH
jgi:hypothetical protein